MKSLFANATLAMYTASVALTAGAPVLAMAAEDSLHPAAPVESLPLEPDTQFDAVRWYDTWWNNSIKGLENIPANFAGDMKGTYKALKSVFTNGVKVGNIMIVRGAPDAARFTKDQFSKMGVHYVDTIRMLPEHLVKVGEIFAGAGKDIARVAVKNAKDTAETARVQGRAIVHDQQDAAAFMKDIAKWMGRAYSDTAVGTVESIKSDATWTGKITKSAVNWTVEQESEAASDTARWMGDYARGDMKVAGDVAEWALKQPAAGAQDTADWTSAAARATGRWTKAVAQGVASDVKETVVSAGHEIVAVNRFAGKSISGVANAVSDAMNAEGRFFKKAVHATAENTFGRLGDVISDEAASTKKSAQWLWKKGYNDGLKAGFDLAGDNYFAGDVEGVAVGTFYSLAAVAEGVGFILVLEPLAFTGHVGLGVTKTVGITGAGIAGTAAVGTAGAVTELGTAAGGAALTVGTAAVGGIADAATVSYEGGRIALHGVIGGALVGGTAVAGGILTAGAATAGAVRTVGGTVGGLAVAGTVATAGFALGEVGLAGAGAVRMAGVGVAGTALTAGALALGGLRMTGDAAWGTVKMVGITAAGGAGEILVPTIDAAVTTYHVARIAGTAIVDNAIITPAIATWDILSALTLGGWQITRDPILGTCHLVAGVTGFSYELVGLSSALAVTAVAGTLYALAHAPLSLVYYGGMWTIAAGAKLLDGVTSPFAFGTQNRWKDERRPQLEEILNGQDRTVQDDIGNKVTYIRVVFSGQDRGKVNFFSTEKDGKTFKFNRKVAKNCLVTYVSKDTPIVLSAKYYDRQCLAEEAGK